MTLTFSLPDGPHVLSDPEPVLIATHAPDAKGMYGRVEYVARHVLRRATAEDVRAWQAAAGDRHGSA